MAVTTPRDMWTDPRIDDLSKKVDAGFEKTDERFATVDSDIRELRRDMNAGFEKTDAKMEAGFAQVDAKMEAGFERLDKKFDWPIRILLGATLTAILTHIF
jgi:hypothetical protein